MTAWMGFELVLREHKHCSSEPPPSNTYWASGGSVGALETVLGAPVCVFVWEASGAVGQTPNEQIRSACVICKASGSRVPEGMEDSKTRTNLVNGPFTTIHPVTVVLSLFFRDVTVQCI